MSLIQELFAKSPFEPMRHHMKSAMECVDLVRPMFEAVRDEKFEELIALSKQIFKKEHQADIIKDQIRQSIPRRFFLPVYRGDLLGLLKLQDDMADAAEDVAVLLTIKQLGLPPSMVDSTFQYISSVEKVCNKAQSVSDDLPRLFETDLGEREVKKILKRVADVEHSEWESDRVLYKLSQELFALEDQIKATDIFLWFRIFGELGTLADHAEKTGERLRRMLST